MSLHALLDRSGLDPGPWVINASNSEVDVRAFGTFLGSLENETLRRTFVRIKKYLVAQDKVGPSSAVMDLPTLLVAERQPLLRLRSP